VKYLSSWCPVYEKLWVVTSINVRDIDLDVFQILDMLSVLLRRLFLGGIRSHVGDSSSSHMASTLISLSSNVLGVSSLSYILVNIFTICWGSIGVV